MKKIGKKIVKKFRKRIRNINQKDEFVKLGLELIFYRDRQQTI